MNLVSFNPKIMYRAIAPKAAAGILATQLAAILPNTLKSTEAVPPAKPTPTTEPIKVCVVDIGTAKNGMEKIRTVVAAPNSAAKPRVGVMWVIFLPTVTITLAPQVITPSVMPALPKRINQVGIAASD